MDLISGFSFLGALALGFLGSSTKASAGMTGGNSAISSLTSTTGSSGSLPSRAFATYDFSLRIATSAL